MSEHDIINFEFSFFECFLAILILFSTKSIAVTLAPRLANDSLN